MKIFTCKLLPLPSLLAAMVGTSTLQAQTFTLHSADIAPGQTIAKPFVYNGFGCTGGNMSPALTWSNPPKGTKSLAITVHDPDAPNGDAGFWHWIVLDLPAQTTQIDRGVGGVGGKNLPKGARQIATDFGSPGWGGPCPPTGDKPHRYEFTVYALRVAQVTLPAKTKTFAAVDAIKASALAKASFTALYGR